jgi:hypothetical protein
MEQEKKWVLSEKMKKMLDEMTVEEIFKWLMEQLDLEEKKED